MTGSLGVNALLMDRAGKRYYRKFILQLLETRYDVQDPNSLPSFSLVFFLPFSFNINLNGCYFQKAESNMQISLLPQNLNKCRTEHRYSWGTRNFEC